MDKAPDAFRTISEVADDLDIPQHVLRFWETRFTQIKPMKRSGGRRYYRPDDVDLLRGIRRLLYGEGYTIRGVQRILKEHGIKAVQALADGSPAVPSFGPLEDNANRNAIQNDRGAAPDADTVDDDDIDDHELAADGSEPWREPAAEVPHPKMEPAFRPAARSAESSSEAIEARSRRAESRARAVEQLRAVLADLVACRDVLDSAFGDGS